MHTCDEIQTLISLSEEHGKALQRREDALRAITLADAEVDDIGRALDEQMTKVAGFVGCNQQGVN